MATPAAVAPPAGAPARPGQEPEQGGLFGSPLVKSLVQAFAIYSIINAGCESRSSTILSCSITSSCSLTATRTHSQVLPAEDGALCRSLNRQRHPRCGGEPYSCCSTRCCSAGACTRLHLARRLPPRALATPSRFISCPRNELTARAFVQDVFVKLSTAEDGQVDFKDTSLPSVSWEGVKYAKSGWSQTWDTEFDVPEVRILILCSRRIAAAATASLLDLPRRIRRKGDG